MATQVITRDKITPSQSPRIAAIDFVRGLVMILMALDHASTYWNSGRVFGEFWFGSRPDPMPDLLQFLLRFIAHWCAPSFVFLAGTSVILFESNRLQRGVSERDITKHLVIRGLILFLLEWTLIAWLFKAEAFYFGVLAAIGTGLIIYAFVRRLNTKVILGFSLLLVLSPVFAHFIWHPLFAPGSHPVDFSFFYIREIFDPLLSGCPEFLSWLQVAIHWPQWPYGIYPVDPWIGVMGLGLVFGRWLLKQQQEEKSSQKIAKQLSIIGGLTLVLFFILRTIQGAPTSYFSLWVADGVLMDSAFAIQNYFWMSKYPPSIVFLLWTLGGMCLALAFAFYLQENENFQKWSGFIVMFGGTALFFYCSHLIVYGAVPLVFGLEKMFSIQVTFLVWILGLLILYPLCVHFKQLKKQYPQSLLKYI